MKIEDIKKLEPYVVEQRRYLHEHPELSWHEFDTSKHVREELDKMGIPYEIVEKVGVVGIINGSKSGKSIGIRADMDALPITENTGLEFSSKNAGVMHACGHDMHTAVLLGTAKVLNEMKDELKGKVVLIFQPSEEKLEKLGASVMKEHPEVKALDRVIGLHVMPSLKAGQAALRVGPVMAATDMFDIFIEGKGGHGAMPHMTVDPIIAGVQLINAFQTIVSREIDPLKATVLSITAFNAGSSQNVIPSEAHLKGTARTFDNDMKDKIIEMMQRIADGVAEATRTKIRIENQKGPYATVNDEKATLMGIEVAKEVFGNGLVFDHPPIMPGEDFSEYLRQTPGVFMFLGVSNVANEFALHQDNFSPREDAMILAVEYFVKYAKKFLEE